ncbi:MAG: phosphoenolpyruvate--protein phosphotransferase [Chthoniobacterales bacterium]|nr:phosphoenolpyruvate--protein phosphotransferase [Chthoniobacterales bacterium]
MKQQSDSTSRLCGTTQLGLERHFQGIAVAPGIVEGPLSIYQPLKEEIPFYSITEQEIKDEIKRFKTALQATQQELLTIQKQLASSVTSSDMNLFDAHLLVLEDPSLLSEILELLHQEKLNIEHIFNTVMQRSCSNLSKVENPYLRERALDIEDVSRRILHHLLKKPALPSCHHGEHPIIVTHMLTPSDVAILHRDHQAAFATEVGSKTSHTAILARAMGVPAVIGLNRLLGEVTEGEPALLDGYHGLLIVNPSAETLRRYRRMRLQEKHLDKDLEKIRETPSTTQDGRHIILSANIELPKEVNDLKKSGAAGIGLYRTEFLYLHRTTPPSEEEQYQVFRTIADQSKPYHAIIRTFDIGGDKPISFLSLPKEANPFLGCRGIRLALQHKELFKVQLRAILRAAAVGNLRMMYPMISGLEELGEANAILEEAKQELRKRRVPFKEDLEVGMMIEVPSAAMIADLLAREVAFFSIGTNDLIQYLTSIDRGNESIAYLYNPAHAGVIRMLKLIVDAAHQEGIWVGVCGELAGDVIFTPILVGLGVDELSASSIFIPRIKKAIQSLTLPVCQELVSKLLDGESAVKNYTHCLHLAQRYYGALFTTE